MLRKRYAECAIEAIRRSVRKWVVIVEGKRECQGWRDCPLCLLYNNSTIKRKNRCRSCPIMHDTERKNCKGSPHARYFEAARHSSAEWVAAQEMLTYLRGLLRRVLRNERRYSEKTMRKRDNAFIKSRLGSGRKR